MLEQQRDNPRERKKEAGPSPSAPPPPPHTHMQWRQGAYLCKRALPTTGSPNEANLAACWNVKRQLMQHIGHCVPVPHAQCRRLISRRRDHNTIRRSGHNRLPAACTPPHLHTHARTHIHVHTHKRTFTHIPTHAFTHTPSHTHTPSYTHLDISIDGPVLRVNNSAAIATATIQPSNRLPLMWNVRDVVVQTLHTCHKRLDLRRQPDLPRQRGAAIRGEECVDGSLTCVASDKIARARHAQSQHRQLPSKVGGMRLTNKAGAERSKG